MRRELDGLEAIRLVAMSLAACIALGGSNMPCTEQRAGRVTWRIRPMVRLAQ